MSREPARSDMLNGEDNASLPYDLRAVEPERVVDVEAGRRAAPGRLRAARRPLRDGVRERDRADRRARRRSACPSAATPAAATAAASSSTLGYAAVARAGGSPATAALSRNRIEEWTQFYDVYDADGRVGRERGGRPPRRRAAADAGGAPQRVGRVEAPRGLSAARVAGRWVGEAQLDNTGNPRLPHPVLLRPRPAGDALARAAGSRRGEPRIRVQATNLLDDDRHLAVAATATSTSSATRPRRDALEGTSYYYPLATRSVYVTLDVRF